MHLTHNNRYRWFERAADHWIVLPILVLVVIIDFFIIFIPSEPIFLAALLGSPKKWVRFSIAMILARVISVALVYWGLIHVPVDQLQTWAVASGMGGAWDRCHHFFNLYGAFSIGITALTPFPMLFVAALAAMARVPLLTLELWAVAGLIIRYGVFSYIGLSGRRWLFKPKP